MPIVISLKGDLLEHAKAGTFDGIAHSCNTQCIMGAGIAAQIKKQYPEAYAADLKTKDRSAQDKLGRYTRAQTEQGFWIINIYGQEHLGQTPEGFVPVDYTALYRGFLRLNNNTRDCYGPLHPFHLGIPKFLGCGLAGGDWDIVSRIINLATPDILVTTVEYNK